MAIIKRPGVYDNVTKQWVRGPIEVLTHVGRGCEPPSSRERCEVSHPYLNRYTSSHQFRRTQPAPA